MIRRLTALMLLAVVACGSPETTKPTDKATTDKEKVKDKEKEKQDGPNPVVLIKTNKGDIKVELFADKSPITVQNFLQYVDDKHYDGTIFHRVMEDFMIQGGGFKSGFGKATSVAAVEALKKSGRPPIRNEAKNGVTNARGTLAMARTGEPHSATDQFFINVVENGNRLDPENSDGHGYAVFGKVLEGMEVVDSIKKVKTKSLPMKQFGKPIFSDVPVDEVVIESIRRAESK